MTANRHHLGNDRSARNRAYTALCQPGADRWQQQWEAAQRARRAREHAIRLNIVIDTTGELVRETVRPLDGRAA